MADGVLQRLLRDPEDLALGVGMKARGAVGAQRDLRPDTRRRTSTCLRSVVASPSASSDAGRSSKISERSSPIASRASACTRSSSAARRRLVALEQRARRLGGQHGREQLLGDGVVQLAGEPVALLDDAQLAAALVQPGVGDRDRGVGGERLDHRLVGVVEVLGALLVGQVERADDLAALDDRHPEERAHVRMRARPPAAEARVGWMSGVRNGSGDSSIAPSIPWVRGSGPIAAISSSLMPDVMKLANAARAVRDAQRRVARAAELARSVDEPLQHGLDLVLAGDREHDVAERAEGGVLHPPPTLWSREAPSAYQAPKARLAVPIQGTSDFEPAPHHRRARARARRRSTAGPSRPRSRRRRARARHAGRGARDRADEQHAGRRGARRCRA